MTKYPSGTDDAVFRMNFEAYKTPPTTYDCLMRNHLQQEISTARDYEGRELLELIQNADDAGADSVWISLSGKRLVISNNGDQPFTVDGYASVMRSDQSTKFDSKYIGCKGLGFRSILNWTSTIAIRSRIAPDSDKGIECRFSQKIATEAYTSLKQFWGALDADVEAFLDQIRQTSGRPVPLSILAVPEVAEWTPRDSTTEIELELSDGIIDEVRTALKSLADSSFYLFLHHLRKLTIDIDGEGTVIECHPSYDGRTFISINGERQEWLVERYENLDEKISAGAARRINPDAGDHHAAFLHSFFPTRIRPGYGCVLHASVELDKSRNDIRATPPAVFRHLAETVIRLAERVREVREDDPTWEAFDILRSTLPEDNLGGQWKEFVSMISEARLHKPFCPSVNGKFLSPANNGKYRSLTGSVSISEAFSAWAETLDDNYPGFDKVLKKGFSSYGIGRTSVRDFEHGLKECSLQQNLDLNRRAELIGLIAEAVHSDPSGDIGIPILTDTKGQVINGTGHIFSGRKNDLPGILSLQIADHDLVALLKSKLKTQYDIFASQTGRDPKEADERKLAAYLRRMTPVTTTDFNDIKERLAEASSRPHKIEDDKEIVRYLFNEYQSSTPHFQFRTKVPLHLLNASGEPTQICRLIYDGNENGRWSPRVRNWDEITGGSPDETKKFIVDVLRMARHVPLRFMEWEHGGFLDKMVDWPTPYKAEEILSSPKYDYGKGYFVDEDWLEANRDDPGHLIREILSDDFAYHEIIRRPYKLYYKAKVYIYEKEADCSPAAHSVRREGIFDNYVAGNRSWIGEEKFDPEELDGPDLERFQTLALALGAKVSMESLDAAAVYDLVARVPMSGHIDKYQEYKDLLAAKPGAQPPKDLMLWATEGGRLLEDKVRASDCFYADNPLPAAIADRIRLFDIGRRVGEDKVCSLFGVRQASSIETVPLTGEGTELKELGDMIRAVIEARKELLLAVRCKRIQAPKIREEQARILKGINIRVYSELDYRFRLPDENTEQKMSLQRGEFIPGKREGKSLEYFLVYDELVNFSSDMELVEIVAGILCHAFKVDGNDIHRKFYDMLRRDDDELRHITRQDYTEEYLKDIKDLISGNLTEKPVHRITYDNLTAVRKTIVNFKVWQLHEKCCQDEARQGGYLDAMKKIEAETETDCRKWFRENKSRFQSTEEMKRALFQKMGLPEDQKAITDTPPMTPEAAEWVQSNFASIFDAQNELGEAYSLLFFRSDLQEIQRLYDRKRQTHAHPDERQESVCELELGEGIISKPPIRKAGHQHDKGAGRVRKNHEEQKIRGRKAEEMVRDYLKREGYVVFKASSNLDSSLDDGAHYDMSYEKEDGVTHFVEVKSTSDGTIHLSAAEYAFATDHENYDLYIVCEGRLSIFENAYPVISKNITPEGYILNFRLKEEE